MQLTSVRAMALCVSLILASVAFAAPANLAELDVFVTDEAGAPVANVLVQVETSAGESFVVVTDDEGFAHVDLKVRGNDPLIVSVSALGGEAEEMVLQRGESLTADIVAPFSRGYEWAWVD